MPRAATPVDLGKITPNEPATCLASRCPGMLAGQPGRATQNGALPLVSLEAQIASLTLGLELCAGRVGDSPYFGADGL
jgi:hypothetical protein